MWRPEKVPSANVFEQDATKTAEEELGNEGVEQDTNTNATESETNPEDANVVTRWTTVVRRKRKHAMRLCAFASSFDGPPEDVDKTSDAHEKFTKIRDPQPITIRVQDVKGDVSFSIASDAQWSTSQLRKAVVAAAPCSYVEPGKACVLAFEGKTLDSTSEMLADLGLTEGSLIIAMMIQR